MTIGKRLEGCVLLYLGHPQRQGIITDILHMDTYEQTGLFPEMVVLWDHDFITYEENGKEMTFYNGDHGVEVYPLSALYLSEFAVIDRRNTGKPLTK